MGSTKFSSVTPQVCHGLGTSGEKMKRVNCSGLEVTKDWGNMKQGATTTACANSASGACRRKRGYSILPNSWRRVKADVTLELGFEG